MEEPLGEFISCGICLEDIKDIGSYTLHCNHVFHEHCIQDWFNNQISSGRPLLCPYCRRIHVNSSPLSIEDGIISMSVFMTRELSNAFPYLQNIKERITRVLNYPHIKTQIDLFYGDSSYSWKKLLCILISGIVIDKIYNP
jgi:hypothetical protein